MPTWLPPSHIRFVMDDYGINHLVGAINLRVQEHGGEVRTWMHWRKRSASLMRANISPTGTRCCTTDSGSPIR